MATAPRETRGARQRARTRAALVAAAHQVVARKGVDAATIAEITEEADVGFGSFYNHFASKESIVEAVIEHSLETHGAALDRLLEDVEDPAEVFAASVRLTVAIGERDPVWGWFVVRVGLTEPAVATTLFPRVVRDIERVRSKRRFKLPDVTLAATCVAGATHAVIRGRLDGVLGENAGALLAERMLVMLGVEPVEAKRVAARSLPQDWERYLTTSR